MGASGGCDRSGNGQSSSASEGTVRTGVSAHSRQAAHSVALYAHSSIRHSLSAHTDQRAREGEANEIVLKTKRPQPFFFAILRVLC